MGQQLPQSQRLHLRIAHPKIGDVFDDGRVQIGLLSINQLGDAETP